MIVIPSNQVKLLINKDKPQKVSTYSVIEWWLRNIIVPLEGITEETTHAQMASLHDKYHDEIVASIMYPGFNRIGAEVNTTKFIVAARFVVTGSYRSDLFMKGGEN